MSGPPRRGSGARQDPHGRGTAAAAGPPPPRERLSGDSGTGRPGTGRETGDPAAGPAGLGGLGRPLPLQSSEMAEHVAIMPRHSGCPARPALISGPRTPLLFPCAPRMGNKTQHVSAAPAHKAPGPGLSGGQSGPSISAPGPLCPSPPCHTFCSRIQKAPILATFLGGSFQRRPVGHNGPGSELRGPIQRPWHAHKPAGPPCPAGTTRRPPRRRARAPAAPPGTGRWTKEDRAASIAPGLLTDWASWRWQ